MDQSKIDWTFGREGRPREYLTPGAVAVFALLVLILLVYWCQGARAHDRLHPGYDDWYGSLRNPHSTNSAVQRFGCCSTKDCHTTEAEMRGNDWWARLGKPLYGAGGVILDWDLQDLVKVPAEAVLLNQSNPTGSAVICHEVDMMNGSAQVDPKSRVWCFVPPTES